MPGANEPVLVTDLRDGQINLSWISSAGATEYMVITIREKPATARRYRCPMRIGSLLPLCFPTRT